MSVLHILNGDSTKKLFTQTNISGDIIVWRECLASGPCHDELGSELFLEKRAAFLEKEFGATPGRYRDDLGGSFNLIKKQNYSEVTLWFEYDLFCIINLFAALSFLKNNSIDAEVFLVDLRQYQQENKFIGLTDIDIAEYGSIYQNRLLINPEDFDLADHLWKSHCTQNANAISEYLNYHESPFYYLGDAIEAYQFIHSKDDSLSHLDSKILDIIQKSNPTHRQLIKTLLTDQSIIGYGDLQYEWHVRQLSEHYNVENEKYYLVANTD